MNLDQSFRSQPGLGRLPGTDKRRRNYPMAAPPVREREYRNWLLQGDVTDQGSTPHCVAYSFDYLLRFHPVVQGHQNFIDKQLLYDEAQKIDYWAGEGYDGTSVDAGARILRDWGYIDGWTWAWDAITVARHVIHVGPVVVGTLWTQGMFKVDPFGYVYPDGPESGGHAYIIRGVNLNKRNPNRTTGAFYSTQTWGPNWGRGSKRHPTKRGHFNITFDDLDALIKSNGEACAVVEKPWSA